MSRRSLLRRKLLGHEGKDAGLKPKGGHRHKMHSSQARGNYGAFLDLQPSRQVIDRNGNVVTRPMRKVWKAP